jgi:hypothetical protein
MALDRTLFTRRTFERATTLVVAAAAVWIVVDVLKMNVDVYGLRTGPIENGPLTLEMQSMADRMCFAPAEVAGRFGSGLFDGVPALVGGRSMALWKQGANSQVIAGSSVVGWMLSAAFAAMLVRLVWLARRRGTGALFGKGSRPPSPLFCLYLALIGIQALLMYSTACQADPGVPILRYLLLALFIPIAVAAAYLGREPVPALRAIAVAVLLAWGAADLRDNTKVIREYTTNPPPYPFRPLADYLVAHNIKYARAFYWDAYLVDFLSRERVLVASDGKIRIREYERLVDEHKDSAVQLQRMPCTEGTRFEAWCIIGPPLPAKPTP